MWCYTLDKRAGWIHIGALEQETGRVDENPKILVGWL